MYCVRGKHLVDIRCNLPENVSAVADAVRDTIDEADKWINPSIRFGTYIALECIIIAVISKWIMQSVATYIIRRVPPAPAVNNQ